MKIRTGPEVIIPTTGPENSTTGPDWTRLDWTRPRIASCGTRIDSCATRIDSCATRIESCATRIDSCGPAGYYQKKKMPPAPRPPDFGGRPLYFFLYLTIRKKSDKQWNSPPRPPGSKIRGDPHPNFIDGHP